MDKKVIIVGNGESGLMADKIAELKAQHIDVEILTIEEAKERGLSQTFEMDVPKLISRTIQTTPPKTRDERRKQKRKKKNRRY